MEQDKIEEFARQRIENVKDRVGLLSEKARSNKLGMMAHTFTVCLILVSYFLEIFKGNRTIGYVLFVTVVGLCTPIAEIITYNRDKESDMIKHFISLGFGAFYTFLILTTQNTHAYVYVIPMLIIITIYNDYRYSLLINISALFVNGVQVVLFISKGIYKLKTDSASIEIQLIVMVIICIYSALASRMLEFNNLYKLEQIKLQNQKTQDMFDSMMRISNEMVSDIANVSGDIEKLDNSIENTKNAMVQVSSGSNDTAVAVQKQLEMTENIQNKINDVTSGTEEIALSVKQTKEAIEVGNENIEYLVMRVNKSVESGKQVTDEIASLNEDMEKMHSVVDIINNITSQTSLLALNASIEAARAGEAGKGFSVVASEISKMANDTQDATVKITSMIQEVTGALNRVINVTGQMIDIIQGQNIATEKTAASFKTISSNADIISDNSQSLSGYVKDLDVANKEIVDSISTISAISEEVAAHSGDTLSISENNIVVVSEVVEITNDLKRLAEELSSEG